MKIRNWIECSLNIVWKILKIGVCLVLCWVGAQVFLFSSYSIPSDSMDPTLLPGDRILVNKTYMGARLFNLKAAFEHEPFKIYRTWGWGKLKTGDVAVFNYPYPQTRDRIGFDIMAYYVKRCIGTPGDSLEIVKGYYKINGKILIDLPTPVRRQQDSLHYVFCFGEKKIQGVSTKAFPKKKKIGWSIVNFGPLYIPKKGDILLLNERHFLIYSKLIEWEQRKKLVWTNGAAYLDGKKITHYHFKKNYYFMSGDNVFNSVDARYWGLIPEEFIAGKVTTIWKSVHPYTGEMRWERIGGVR